MTEKSGNLTLRNTLALFICVINQKTEIPPSAFAQLCQFIDHVQPSWTFVRAFIPPMLDAVF